MPPRLISILYSVNGTQQMLKWPGDTFARDMLSEKKTTYERDLVRTAGASGPTELHVCFHSPPTAESFDWERPDVILAELEWRYSTSTRFLLAASMRIRLSPPSNLAPL